jgi:adenine C2-methylase RlmN of 23S rRNA A2503 and tRNA A37
VSQLAEQHRDQLRPTTKALGCSFCAVLLHQRRELKAREVLQQLIKREFPARVRDGGLR